MRRLGIAIALVAAAVLPSMGTTAARADSHCNDIYLFSTTVVDTPAGAKGNPSVVSSAIGCTVLGENPTTPGDEFNTDWIYPLSNTLQVRWIRGELAADVTGTLTYNGGAPVTLTFTDTTNNLGPVVDSQLIPIDPTTTLAGAKAQITVCTVSDPTDCESRTYTSLV